MLEKEPVLSEIKLFVNSMTSATLSVVKVGSEMEGNAIHNNNKKLKIIDSYRIKKNYAVFLSAQITIINFIFNVIV